MGYKEDREQAQAWCLDIKKGKTRQVVEEILQRHEEGLEKHLDSLLYKYNLGRENNASGASASRFSQDIMQEFRKKLCENHNIICRYEARNRSTLRTHLQAVLRNTCKEYFRREGKHFHANLPQNPSQYSSSVSKNRSQKGLHNPDTSSGLKQHPEEDQHHPNFPRPRPKNPFQLLDDKQQEQLYKKILHEALLRLTATAPQKAMIKMLRLEGKSYAEIADMLGYNSNDAIEMNNLRQQSKRTEKDLRAITNHLLLQQGLRLYFDEGHPRLVDARMDNDHKHLCRELIRETLRILKNKRRINYTGVAEKISEMTSRRILLAVAKVPGNNADTDMAAFTRAFKQALREKGYRLSIDRGIARFIPLADATPTTQQGDDSHD